MRRLETEVLVVGGGPVGLSAATLLGRLGVDVVMVERRPGAAEHPRARSINLRTGEIFRLWGIDDALDAVSLPVEWTRHMRFGPTLAAGDVACLDTDTQGELHPGGRPSPSPWRLSSQDQFEPVIRRVAEGLDGVDLRWEHELVDLAVADDGVVGRVRPLRGGDELEVAARWAIAADGAASGVRRSLGVELTGKRDITHLVNTQIVARLGPWTDHRPAMLYWTLAPNRNIFQKIDRADRWLCQITYDPQEASPADFTPERCAASIRAAAGVPDLELEVVDVIPWTMNSAVADRFRIGPVFLAGDAAHLLPPSGGFGMNTGVQDVHNLAWKLAFVLRGWAAEGLLDSYEVERRPLAAYNAERSLANSVGVGRLRKAAERGDQAGVAAQVAALKGYGNFLGMDLGLVYEEGALVPDGTDAPVAADPVSEYVPTARPGHRAPHLWVEHRGRRISTIDLFEDAFVLLAGPEGNDWADAASLAAPVVRTYVIGRDLEAPAEAWAPYGIGRAGAVLVRPDGHVAARWADEPVDVRRTLGTTLSRLLR